MNIIAFAASNSRNSINHKLVAHAAGAVAGAHVDLLDINDFEMPIYSEDRESENGIPQLAHDFYNKLGGADVLMISFAEHNGSYSAAYKNLFDWASRIDTKVYQGKRVILLATSPGPGGASNVLAGASASAPHFGGELLASLSVPSFYDNFDTEKGGLKNEDLQASLQQALDKLS